MYLRLLLLNLLIQLTVSIKAQKSSNNDFYNTTVQSNISSSTLISKKRDELDSLSIAANHYFETGEYSKALLYYKQAYKNDSNNIQSILGIIHTNEKIGKSKENLFFYNQLLIKDSANAISYRKQIAAILEGSMLFKDALEHYRIIFQNNSKDWETALRFCDILLKLNLPEKADSIINTALKANSDICALQYKKGGISYLLGTGDTSIFYVKKAFACGDTLLPYFKTIGLAYMDMEEYDSALHYLSHYVKAIGNDEKSYSSIGTAYSQKLRLDSSIIYYTKACDLGISQNYIFNCKSLAFLLEEEQQYEKALEVYYKIYYLCYDAEAIYKIASIEDKRKNYRTALVWYKKYLNSNDNQYKNVSINRKKIIIEMLSKESFK